MTKSQAVRWIEEIQNGKFDRNEVVDQIPRGRIAIEYWDNPIFTYGMEYGAILILMKVFDIKKDEV